MFEKIQIFVSLNKNDNNANIKISKNALTSPFFCVTIDAEQEKDSRKQRQL